MKGIRALCFGLLLLFASGASAQLVEKVLDILNEDTLGTVVAQKPDTDSLHLLKIKEDLETSRLNEANLRMEIEQMKLKYDAADSLKLAKQRLRIDSLRRMTPGIPVIVEGDTLYYLFAKRGGHTPQQRAEMNAAAITELGKRFNLQPDSVYIDSSDIVTDLMYGNKVLSSFTDQDGLWEGCSRDQLAAAKRKVIVDKLKVMKDEHSPLLFAIFPQTKDLAYKLFSYIWEPIKSIFLGIVEYIPNLFTIFVIWLAVKYLVRLVRYLASEIQSERLKIGGFYADWAMPTFHIVRFLLYAFMIAMIYPYLPGSKSGVFQGISVFVGLIVSLGSSTVIGNIIAGMVITYMRPFKLGDRIKLNDTTGNVIEKTPLVTRIRTPKNEVVTIPNSFIMSSHTVNFSQSARDYGLIIHSEVSIGYDIPWRKTHQLLIEAALNTPGVVDDPRPFVLETSLQDYYPVYQVNAYIKDANQLAQVYSDLHQNIQDRFNEEGIEIMSPHYIATRDGNETTIPKDDLRGKK